MSRTLPSTGIWFLTKKRPMVTVVNDTIRIANLTSSHGREEMKSIDRRRRRGYVTISTFEYGK